MAFIGSITQSGIRNGDVKPGVSVMFNVVFKNIGEDRRNLALRVIGISLKLTDRYAAKFDTLQYNPWITLRCSDGGSTVDGAFPLVLCSGVSAALCGAAHAQRSQVAVQAPPQAAPGQSPAGHAPEMRIAAVVNDEVISVFDLASRMQMVMLSSNIPDTPELRERMGRQVLRSLIDERLQLQEAKRQNVRCRIPMSRRRCRRSRSRTT